MSAKNPIFETTDIEQLPALRTVNVIGPDHRVIPGYQGIQRMDTNQIVSIMSDRYALVQHRSVAEVAKNVGETFGFADPKSFGADLDFVNRLEARDPGHFRQPLKYSLYAGGRKMEAKLIIADLHKLRGGEEFYPGFRFTNSLDGSTSIQVTAFAVRLACTNQLYAERKEGRIFELRQLHLASALDILGQVRKAVATSLDQFDSMLDIYNNSMNAEIMGEEVTPALLKSGMPLVHADIIGHRAEVLSTHNALMSRWSAYQVATEYLTYEVQVSPDRAREFEREAASALLLTEADEAGTLEAAVA